MPASSDFKGLPLQTPLKVPSEPKGLFPAVTNTTRSTTSAAFQMPTKVNAGRCTGCRGTAVRVATSGLTAGIIVAATTGRSSDRVAIGRIAERAGGPRGNRSLTRLRTIEEAAELLNASRPAVGSNGARAPPQKENPARWSEVSSVLSKNQVSRSYLP
jgi:hypothetical protein